MIQRIQTVYLFFAFCLIATLVFIPFYSSTSSIMGFNSGCFTVIALSAIITIFLFKKRNLQIRICYAMILSLVIAYIIYFIVNFSSLSLSELNYTFLFPFIAIILIYLAIIGIKKDEKLIRSLDRLR
jgi:FtsH-binding integral membrane protein